MNTSQHYINGQWTNSINHKVIISNSVDNRDPSKFQNPDEYDINRKSTGHIGFGRSVHGCLGMHVAKLEAEFIIQSLLDRVKSFTLDGVPTYKLNNTVRSLATLPIRVET